MPKGRPRLDEVVSYRLAEIHDLFTSGVSDLTGRLRRSYVHGEGQKQDRGEVVGRFGGVKKSFHELRGFKETPARIAKAIERGTGRLFEQLHAAVAEEFAGDYSEAPRKAKGRPTVPPHKRLRPYCLHCRSFHTKGAHRFHGRGAFHRTHLWGFPKLPPLRNLEGAGMTHKQASDTFRDLMAKARTGKLTEAERAKLTKARQVLRRERRPAANPSPARRKTPAQRNAMEKTVKRFPRNSRSTRVMALAQRYRQSGNYERVKMLWPDQTADRRYHLELYKWRSNKRKQPAAGRRRSSTARANPGALLRPKRIGNAVELRYDRDVGARQGYYKHVFTSRNLAVVVIPKGKTVRVTGGVVVGGRVH